MPFFFRPSVLILLSALAEAIFRRLGCFLARTRIEQTSEFRPSSYSGPSTVQLPASNSAMTDNEPSTSASASTSILKEDPAPAKVNGSALTKKVQVVGQPPAFHGTGRKEETKAAAGSDDEEEPDEETLGQESDDKTRVTGDGEVKDEDLLAEFDEDEDVSFSISMS